MDELGKLASFLKNEGGTMLECPERGKVPEGLSVFRFIPIYKGKETSRCTEDINNLAEYPRESI